MRAVVIGGSGQIGGSLLHALEERGHEAIGTYASVAFPGLSKLDAADLEGAAEWVKGQRPDVVFYPAGLTWVDGCERDPEVSRAANRVQPLNIARAAHGARFVYFSTDYVFDGKAGPYTEADPPNPLSVYGRSKREAEIDLMDALGARALIVRTTWAYGPERQGKNFAYQLVKTLAAGNVFACPSDQISSPSYSPDIARTAVALVEAGRSGIVNVAGPEVVDRATFARAIALAFGLDPALIVGKPTAALGQGAPRPLNSGLRVDQRTPPLRPLAEALVDFRERLATDQTLARVLPP
jgi:dTDP-4-dehydrorhamnose reductase